MQVNPLSLTTKQYSILGRLCASQKPDVARELLSIYDAKPSEQDHKRIDPFFITFCQMHNMNPEEYRGSLFKTWKVDQRRLFIACMVRLYLPHLHAASTIATARAAGIRLDYGFIRALAETLRQNRQNVCKVVREVVVYEKAYPEFKMSVDEVVCKLTEKEVSNGSA